MCEYDYLEGDDLEVICPEDILCVDQEDGYNMTTSPQSNSEFVNPLHF